MKSRILAAAVVSGMICFSFPAYAGYQSFTSLPGGTLDGLPVSAKAEFTTSSGQVALTLTNLQANPIGVIQAISDIFFTATTGGVVSTATGAGSFNAAGNYISIDKAGATSPAGTNLRNWQLTNSTGTYHLNKLWGGDGSGTGPQGLIIGDGPYTSANGSIAGNSAHNPFVDQSATFTLALLGVTTDTIISDVVFSFGTTAGRNVGVPIPAAVWLFGSGLLGLIAIARRRQGGAVRSGSLVAA